jgi:hypothetical protein
VSNLVLRHLSRATGDAGAFEVKVYCGCNTMCPPITYIHLLSPSQPSGHAQSSSNYQLSPHSCCANLVWNWNWNWNWKTSSLIIALASGHPSIAFGAAERPFIPQFREPLPCYVMIYRSNHYESHKYQSMNACFSDTRLSDERAKEQKMAR